MLMLLAAVMIVIGFIGGIYAMVEGKNWTGLMCFIFIVIGLVIGLPEAKRGAAKSNQQYNDWVNACHARGGRIMEFRNGQHCVDKRLILD